MYSEFLFAAKVNYIADSVVSIFSILNINDILLLSAVQTLNVSDVNFFSFLKMIIQRFLTFKTLIIFFFHVS